MKLASGEWHEVPAIREILKWSYRRKSLDSPLTSVLLEDCEDDLTDIWATYSLEHNLAIKFKRTTSDSNPIQNLEGYESHVSVWPPDVELRGSILSKSVGFHSK
jgi:hypothetical protein